MKKITILIVAIITALAGIVPAQAFPVLNMEKPQISGPVELVRDQRRIIRPWHGRSSGFGDRGYRNYGNRYYGGRDFGNRYYGNRYYGNRFDRGYYGNRYYGNRFYGNRYYGNRYYGGRYYGRNDAGIFFGGLAAGAIIGGALNSTPRYYGNNSHTRWCYARYRSYRAWDNTYQPNYGPRRQCVIR